MRRDRTRLEDLAKAAGVSIATASRSLNNSPAVNEETKKRIWKLAREMNYNFRPSMPALISSSSSTIAIVMPPPSGRRDQASDPFHQELIAGISEAARDVGCDVLITHITLNDPNDLNTLMTANRADGIIFLGQSAYHEHFNKLAETQNRFIVWGAELPDQNYCSIGSDNVRGGQRATAHLITMGRRRIAFIGTTESAEARQRFAGYLAAHQNAVVDVDPALIVSASFEIESAEAATDKLISSGINFDGVVASSDLVALGAIRSLSRAKIRVPEHVSVVGYDNIQLAAYTQPALTTISQDLAKAGRLMVSKILASGDGGPMRSERLPTDLLVRESCSVN
ncbi:MAG: LacI family DNA-binding transcriptional regulator [Hyphomonas sp.]